jgi:hypothetical protein
VHRADHARLRFEAHATVSAQPDRVVGEPGYGADIERISNLRPGAGCTTALCNVLIDVKWRQLCRNWDFWSHMWTG